MSNKKKYEILFADESEMINEVMQFAFELDQFNVTIANTKNHIIEKCKTKKFDLIIVSIDFEGINISKEIQKTSQNSNTKIIIISKTSDIETKREAKKNNISGWIQKPFVPEKLVKSIRYI